MAIHSPVRRLSWSLVSILSLCLLAGCLGSVESCPLPEPVDLSPMEAFAAAGNLPFQFPLEGLAIFKSRRPFSTGFAEYGMTTRGPEYHAAEDILQPAGTAVYAIADGTVSYSGPRDGYGWLELCPQELGWLQPSLVIASQDLQFVDPPEQASSLPGP